MKGLRLFTAFSLVCLIVVSSFGQSNKMYGVKGGFTLSNFWGSGTDNLNSSLKSISSSLDEKNLPWFVVSLFSSNEIIPDFTSVQSELVYYRGGKEYKATISGAEKKLKIDIDYLQIPLMLKIHFPFPLKPSIYAGPQVSWMFRSRLENFPDTVSTTPFFSGKDVSGVYNANTNVIDLGFVAGLDFNIPFGPGSLVLDGRYNMGALDVFNYSAARKVRNYVFMMMAGYAFNFGGSM